MQSNTFRTRNLSRFKPLIIAAVLSIFFSTICALFASKKIVRNTTDSLPHGIYYITSRANLNYGDIVCFAVPTHVERIVYGRGWLNEGNIMMKKVAAMPGDRICSDGSKFTITSADKTKAGAIRPADRQGRPLPAFKYCGVIEKNLLFVGSATDPQSFDSRYFGLVQIQEVIGVAKPLWIF
jgi:conjugative transfer signal peptidase TraF